MRGCVVAFGTWRDRQSAARMIDGHLDDLLIDVEDAHPRPGAIYRAICDRPVKGQGGMFVRLSDTQKGFLRQAKGLAAGQSLFVQVTGYAEATKAIPVTTKLVVKSRYVLTTPGAPGLNIARSIKNTAAHDQLLELADATIPERADIGIIIRTAALEADPQAVVEDLETTWAVTQAVMSDDGSAPELLLDGPVARERAWIDWTTPLPDEITEAGFETLGIADAIAAEKNTWIDLRPGRAFIETTRAFVAVDVDTGADASVAAGLKANLMLAKVLPRTLRVRGLGGQIVIDPAPMPKKDRQSFETALKAAFRRDLVATTAVGWTPLGHYELTRKRERRPLGDYL